MSHLTFVVNEIYFFVLFLNISLISELKDIAKGNNKLINKLVTEKKKKYLC